ncbi:MAG: DHH family phosphoesterase [Patescibacteria group bacterium]
MQRILKLKRLMSPSKIKNIEKAAERIKQAAKNKERIILYGDSDCDGICSVVILEEAIKNLGGEVSAIAFPDRETDGYGINLKALEFLKDYTPAFLITLDLGIANVKEVVIANKMGFKVIIIDHHEVLDELPKAEVIVDPQQKEDFSDFKYLCNAGLTFKVVEEILEKNLSESLKNSFLELTALATIADMMPRIGDNKVFIEEGLRSLKNTFRPGLRAFLDILGEGETAAGGYLKIISALNASESTGFSAEGGSASGGKNESYELLTSFSKERCKDLAEDLISRTELKQQRIKSIVEEVERRILKKPSEIIIFEGDPAWKLTLAGPVASIIASKYEKPTFIFRKMDKESAGSVRSLKEGQNSVDAMKSCSDLLMTYGGHPKASGFRIKNENLENFKTCLIKHFQK